MATDARKKLAEIPDAAPSVKKAKLFRNGRSQAVRLPKEFRFEGTEVAIRRDPATGEVTLSPTVGEASRAGELDLWARAERGQKLTAEELFTLFDQAGFPKDFFKRETHAPRELDLF